MKNGERLIVIAWTKHYIVNQLSWVYSIVSSIKRLYFVLECARIFDRHLNRKRTEERTATKIIYPRLNSKKLL